MVHGIIFRTRAGHLLEYHLELFRHTRRLVGVAAQGQEFRIECGDVFGEHLRRVSLRIDGHQQYLHLLSRWPEFLYRDGEFGERRRTNIGAVGKTEKHHHDLPAKILQRARIAVVIGQGKRFAEIRTGNIRGLEAQLP